MDFLSSTGAATGLGASSLLGGSAILAVSSTFLELVISPLADFKNGLGFGCSIGFGCSTGLGCATETGYAGGSAFFHGFVAAGGAVTLGFTVFVALEAIVGGFTSSAGLSFFNHEASLVASLAGGPTLKAPSAGFFSNPKTPLRLDTDCACGASYFYSA